MLIIMKTGMLLINKHWLEGLAEIDIEKKKEENQGPTVNDVAKVLNKEAIADLSQPKKSEYSRYDPIVMEGFTENSFGDLTGTRGQRKRKKVEKKSAV
mmetsp:Transcript_19709/g.17421  ORF Transcript_19709/g.17421 Transcript_19709/m.17421 type:complete len:98 (+) Transcript_19709:408-701(+)